MTSPLPLPVSPLVPAAELRPPLAPVQHISKVRRDYNSWVASETMKDYALRFTPQRFRKWSEWRVANTAFGAPLLVKYGFTNAFWAIWATGLAVHDGAANRVRSDARSWCIFGSWALRW